MKEELDAYTENGLLKSKSESGRTQLEYTYDRNRKLTSLADSAGNIVYYSYDVMNHLKRVSGGNSAGILLHMALVE